MHHRPEPIDDQANEDASVSRAVAMIGMRIAQAIAEGLDPAIECQYTVKDKPGPYRSTQRLTATCPITHSTGMAIVSNDDS